MHKKQLMDEVTAAIQKCRKCPLHETRKNVVPGEGSLDSPVVFVGEAPGADEDVSGRPFVGRAGKLLDEILKAVSLSRSDIYITNIVKCRPPNNRDPIADEMNKCSAYLFSQLQIINPQVIVTLGRVPLIYLLDKKGLKITKMRGKKIEYKNGVDIFPMFHPSYLLRNQSKSKGSPKYLTWLDIKEVRRLYDESKKG